MKSQREGSKTLLGLFGASCRAAAQSARRAGVDSVWAWDDFLDADLISIAEAIPLSEFRLEENKDQEPSLDGLPIVLCGGMENQPDLVQALIERGVQCGTNGLMLRELRSVVHWEKWALESGVGWPESFFVSEYLKGDRKNGVRAAAIASGNRWMCKSTVGAGGMRVQRFDSLEAFVRDFKSHRDSLTEEIERTSFDQTTYAQRMVDGITIGVSYCASSDGVRIAGIARGIVKGEFVAPREFIYRGNTAPYPVPEELREALQRFGNVVTAAT